MYVSPFLVGLGGEVFLGDLELELQQALVDRPQVADFQRLVVDEHEGQRPLVLVPGEPVDGQGQVAVGDLVLQQEAGDALVPAVRLVRRRVEQAAVVGRHVEDRVALVHRLEQLAEPVVERRVLRGVGLFQPLGHVALGDAGLVGDLLLDLLEAGRVVRRFPDRQQVPALGVEQEEQPVEQRQRGLEDVGQFVLGRPLALSRGGACDPPGSPGPGAGRW